MDLLEIASLTRTKDALAAQQAEFAGLLAERARWNEELVRLTP